MISLAAIASILVYTRRTPAVFVQLIRESEASIFLLRLFYAERRNLDVFCTSIDLTVHDMRILKRIWIRHKVY